MKTTSKKNLERLKVCENLASNLGDERGLLPRAAAGNRAELPPCRFVFGEPLVQLLDRVV